MRPVSSQSCWAAGSLCSPDRLWLVLVLVLVLLRVLLVLRVLLLLLQVNVWELALPVAPLVVLAARLLVTSPQLGLPWDLLLLLLLPLPVLLLLPLWIVVVVLLPLPVAVVVLLLLLPLPVLLLLQRRIVVVVLLLPLPAVVVVVVLLVLPLPLPLHVLVLPSLLVLLTVLTAESVVLPAAWPLLEAQLLMMQVHWQTSAQPPVWIALLVQAALVTMPVMLLLVQLLLLSRLAGLFGLLVSTLVLVLPEVLMVMLVAVFLMVLLQVLAMLAVLTLARVLGQVLPLLVLLPVVLPSMMTVLLCLLVLFVMLSVILVLLLVPTQKQLGAVAVAAWQAAWMSWRRVSLLYVRMLSQDIESWVGVLAKLRLHASAEPTRLNMSGSKPPAAWLTVKPFVNGGLSGMAATCIIQPIDMVKVRIQLGAKGSPLSIAQQIVKADGMGALYKGLSAGLLRQATYTTARMGLFNQFSAMLKEANGGQNLPLWQKAVAGLGAGGLGAFVGTPADLTLIRMQSDNTLPLDQRRNYKGVGDAFVRIVKEDGVSGLFRGATPTIVRAMALNMGMLASNDQAKESIEALGFAKGSAVPVMGGAFIAGFFASACSLPFDFVKTQMQKMKPGPDGKMPYSGSLDCAMKTLKNHGPLHFYSGFSTYIVRIAPHVVFTLSFLELLPKAEKMIGL
ncbi:hypothetical protein QJQ45_010671 [Haematococcus lacustris]|nr:hypothetical protein QJQ45_010671 [Haematococcus lacustris]